MLTLILLVALVAVGGCRKDKDFQDDRNAAELYSDAKESLDNKSWGRAIQQYKMLQTRYPFGRYTEQSMLDLSYAYFKGRDAQSALSNLDRFIRTYPAHPNVDYAYYLKGMYAEATFDLDSATAINPKARQVEQLRGMINERGLEPR